MQTLIKTNPAPVAGTPWPFIVRQMQSGELADVRRLRHLAYSRKTVYQPDFADSLQSADRLDKLGRSLVLVAVDKTTGQLQGTVRLTSSRDVPDVLPPFVPRSSVTQSAFTFVDRLAVRPGVDQQVAAALMKALWLWAGHANTDGLVALAQRILVKHYAKWGGLRLLGEGLPLEVPEHLKEPVYFVGARLAEARAQVLAVNPDFDRFVFTHHADLVLPAQPQECAHA